MAVSKGKRIFYDWLMIAAGAVLYSISVNMFCVPNGFVQGGLTGVSIMLASLFPIIPVGAAMFVMNIPLFIAGYFKIGKGFILKTTAATFVFTFAIDVGERIIPPYVGDGMLACLFCGVFSGLGIALVMLAGATTGGTEIVAMLVRQKFSSVPIGRMILFVDLVIIAVSYFVYKNVQTLMYASVALFVSSYMIDFILGGAGHNKVMFVVTDSPKKISAAIMSEIHRGVTVLPAQGGYTGSQKSMLFCAARASEISRIYRKVNDIDENSFTVIGDIGEVLGNGWKS
ncbi:MAG: YitT family protein [Acutalibacteraceae bacterium]